MLLFKHFPGYDVFIPYILRFTDRHVSKIGSHLLPSIMKLTIVLISYWTNNVFSQSFVQYTVM